MMTDIRISFLKTLMRYSNFYEISIQFWPEQCTVYIAKDGVDLYSYGSSDVEETLSESVKYLNRINKVKKS